MKYSIPLAFVIIVLAGSCQGDGDGEKLDPNIIRETGYLSCEPSEECGADLKCTDEDGASACVPIPASCDGTASCACAGDAVCGDRSCEPGEGAGALSCVDSAGPDADVSQPDAGDEGGGTDAPDQPDTEVQPPACEPADFTYEHPLPQGSHLYDLFGRSSDDAWAVGAHTVLRWNGSEWSVASTCGQSIQFYGVWGPAADDVTLVGAGYPVHWDGSSFSTLTSAPPGQYQAVDGLDTGALLIVGLGGQIVHFDGEQWSTMTSGTTETLYDVWYGGLSDAFAVGENGTLLHWDGNAEGAWTSVAHPAGQSRLETVWGAAGDDVWAGGSDTVIHFDGAEWGDGQVAPGALDEKGVRKIFGTGADDVYAVGGEGFVMRWDGDSWAEMATPLQSSLTAVWGTPGDIHATGSGGVLLRRLADGAWEELSNQGPGFAAYSRLWGSSSDDVWAVGWAGELIHRDAGGWSKSQLGTAVDLHDVWGDGPDLYIAVGDAGAAHRWDGAGWSTESTGVTAALRGIWGAGAGEAAWAVGDDGTITRRGAAGSWAAEDSGITAGLTSVHGTGEGDVWAVGVGGTVVHYAGAWLTVDAGTTVDLNAVWAVDADTVYLAGQGGTLIRRSGGVWSPIDLGTGQTLLSLFATGADDVWVGGIWRTVSRWDGTVWSPLEMAGSAHGASIWGTGTDTWVLSGGSILRHL